MVPMEIPWGPKKKIGGADLGDQVKEGMMPFFLTDRFLNKIKILFRNGC